jgi:hypothetical protein
VCANGRAGPAGAGRTRTEGLADDAEFAPWVYPPTREQDEIVEILYTLDRKIAIHAEICTTTSRLRDSLLPLLMSNETSRD